MSAISQGEPSNVRGDTHLASHNPSTRAGEAWPTWHLEDPESCIRSLELRTLVTKVVMPIISIATIVIVRTVMMLRLAVCTSSRSSPNCRAPRRSFRTQR